MSALDTQVGGDHYKKMAIQPMAYSMKNKLDACQHTIIKYVTRFREKGGIQDLEKAKHVIDMLIQFENEEHGEKGVVDGDLEEAFETMQKNFEAVIQEVLDEGPASLDCNCFLCQLESEIQKILPGSKVRVVGAGKQGEKNEPRPGK